MFHVVFLVKKSDVLTREEFARAFADASNVQDMQLTNAVWGEEFTIV